PTATSASLGVGEDVAKSARQWLNGDLNGRSVLEALANMGRADAQQMLGEILSVGPKTLRDDVASCGWFAKAADSRADSMHSLAFCTEKGVDGTPDPARAAGLYLQAAEQGYAKSMCALGNLYVEGRGVPKDEAKGVARCRKGAEIGDRDAQTDLGNYYLQGIGVPRDMAQARHWYELAAAQGQPNALFVLGQIYWNGDGILRDQARAEKLLKAAYRSGRRDAASFLGSWLFAKWMSAHSKGDFTVLDEAIGYQTVAASIASEAERADAQNALKLMEAVRTAAKDKK
ncbi:MAG: sel1 repeat family protein, partial [Sphingobacteriales bacterium]